MAAAPAACGSGSGSSAVGVSSAAASGPARVIAACPKQAPSIEGEPSPGAAGEVVPAGPTVGFVCRWAEGGKGLGAHAKLRGAALAGLVAALNASPTIEAGEESEGCGGSPFVTYLVSLGYPGKGEVRVVASLEEADVCDAVVNRAERTIYGGTQQLGKALDATLGG
jgi:hypothetical protein